MMDRKPPYKHQPHDDESRRDPEHADSRETVEPTGEDALPRAAEEGAEEAEAPYVPKRDPLVTEALGGEEDAPAWVPLPPETPKGRLLHGVRRYGFGALFVFAVVLSSFYFYEYGGEGQDTPAELLTQVNVGGGAEAPAGAAQGALERAADLSIETYPAGATVLVDFDSVGMTPLREHRLNPGVYVVSVRKPAYAALDTVVFVSGGEATAFSFLLEEAIGEEAAAEEPTDLAQAGAEAQALLEAQARREPARVEAQESRASPVPAARPAGPAAAEPVGRLLVTSEPSGVSVYLNEESIGTTPLLFPEAAPGPYQVTMRKDGYKSFTAVIDVGPDETAKVNGKLEALSGQLIVLVQPWGSIYIDEELHKRDTDVQYVTQLPVGTHRVKAVHPTLGTLERVVRITGDTPQQLVIHFTPSAAQGTEASEGREGQAPASAVGSSAVQGEDGIYVVAEEPPVLIGGLAGLHRSIQYPRLAHEKGIEGRVYLNFVVDEEGRVQDAAVVRGIGLGCDEEALRAIRLARFQPGTVGGRPVKVRHALYINYNLGDS